MVGDSLIRRHYCPRTTLFVPTTENCPIPLKYIDIFRNTKTDLPSLKERTIYDFRTDGSKELSDTWTGSTTFLIMRPPPPPGTECCDGRITKKQKTTRPKNVWVETWKTLSKEAKTQAIEDWKIEGPLRQKAREKANVKEIVDADDMHDYIKTLAETRKRIGLDKVPAMPCREQRPRAYHAAASAASTTSPIQTHNDDTSSQSTASSFTIAKT